MDEFIVYHFADLHAASFDLPCTPYAHPVVVRRALLTDFAAPFDFPFGKLIVTFYFGSRGDALFVKFQGIGPVPQRAKDVGVDVQAVKSGCLPGIVIGFHAHCRVGTPYFQETLDLTDGIGIVRRIDMFTGLRYNVVFPHRQYLLCDIFLKR